MTFNSDEDLPLKKTLELFNDLLFVGATNTINNFFR